MAKKKKEKRTGKFDVSIDREGMGTVEKEGSSEETGLNPGNKDKKNNSPKTGEGIEEFVDDKPNFRNGEKDET
jgi:hypothetical protein